jgi:hypothetical protein
MASRVIGRYRTKSLQNDDFVRDRLGLPSLSNDLAVFGFALPDRRNVRRLELAGELSNARPIAAA